MTHNPVLKTQLENFLKDVDIYNDREDLVDEKGGDIHVVIGGDGTLNYFLNNEQAVIEGENVSLLYFPMGTANDFAKSFKISQYFPSLERIIDAVQSSYKIKIPSMLCNERLFLNAASLGLPANISEDQNSVLKKIAGPISYHLSALSELFAHEQAQEVSIDNETFKTLGVVISQGLYAGGGAKVNPHFNPQIGKTFSLIMHTGENVGPCLSAFFSMQTNDFENMPPEIMTKDYERVVLSFKNKQKIKLDGEVYEASDFEFKKSKVELNFYCQH